MSFDFDYLVIGSGFGGSVSALRLTEKGYKVAVLEMGKRWTAETLPSTNWDTRRFLWLPELLCHGIFKMTLMPHVFILSGTGVGGGSLVYANTLLVPKDAAWQDPKWKDLADWKSILAPHYATAQRMLGVTRNPRLFAADHLIREYGASIGQAETFAHTDVGVFFGEAGKKVPDPFFGGEGPERVGCTHCGACMVGCKVGAKNTLDRNYLYLAEKKGCQIFPERRVERIEPMADGGYRVHTVRSTSLLFKDPRSYTAKGVVVSAGVLGSVNLLLKNKQEGTLPKLSAQLGAFVRTNSEAILGVSQRQKDQDFSKGVAIGSRVDLDEHTHLEPCRYPAGSGVLALITTPLTDGGGSSPRWWEWFKNVLKAPLDAIRGISPFGWAERTVVLLVMQNLDNRLGLQRRWRWWWPFSKGLTTEIPEGQEAVPTYIPAANAAAKAMSAQLGGLARSSVTEALLNVPTTAHILGGCAMGKSAEDGVIDWRCRVFGYENLLVVDGSMIGANLGVNPSLTITAIAEHAMSHVEKKN